MSDDFYNGIRCGILHQAETTNGWRIRRGGHLYNTQTKTINATMFLDDLMKALKLYMETLMESDWDSDIWQNLREKMASVIKNSILADG